MPRLQVEATTDQLLQAVAQLTPDELVTFVERVLELRAERTAPRVSGDETALLLQINLSLPDDLQRRYDDLVAARRNEALTPEEQAELLRLTDDIERFEADRVAALAALAHLRRTTLSHLMRDLGIEPRPYA